MFGWALRVSQPSFHSRDPINTRVNQCNPSQSTADWCCCLSCMRARARACVCVPERERGRERGGKREQQNQIIRWCRSDCTQSLIAACTIRNDINHWSINIGNWLTVTSSSGWRHEREVCFNLKVWSLKVSSRFRQVTLKGVALIWKVTTGRSNQGFYHSFHNNTYIDSRDNCSPWK